MTTLSKRERDNLDLVLPTVERCFEHLKSFGVLPINADPSFRDAYSNACVLFASLFVIPASEGALMRALESYNELDAELLKAQETIAELEETLEAANRDLESYQVSTFKG